MSSECTIMFATCFPDGTFPVLPSCMSKSSPPCLKASSPNWYLYSHRKVSQSCYIKEMVRVETEWHAEFHWDFLSNIFKQKCLLFSKCCLETLCFCYAAHPNIIFTGRQGQNHKIENSVYFCGFFFVSSNMAPLLVLVCFSSAWFHICPCFHVDLSQLS